MHEHGDSIPHPRVSDVWEIHHRLTDDEKEDLRFIQLVQGTIPGKAIRLNISMEEELVKRIDAAAGSYGRSRFLAEAAKAKLSGTR